MNEQFCEREQILVAGLRGGALSAELLDHAAACPICSEVLLVTEWFQAESTSLERELHIPDAAVIWRKAQAAARAQALAKATLPIVVVRICACAIAAFAAPWLLLEFWLQPAWMPDLGLSFLSSVDASWLTAFTRT